MMLTKRPSRNEENQLQGLRSSINSDATPTFSSLPSLMDEFFFNNPLFKWGTDWISESGRSLGTTLPAVNIRETNEEFVLEVAAPGMKKQDFKIECENNQLHISYHHKEEKSQGNQTNDYWRREFNFDSFDRSFQLPESVDSEKIHAQYQDGILRVMVAKREETRKKPSREIPIL